jgi:ABC-type cobalamin transport system ATPase subunit
MSKNGRPASRPTKADRFEGLAKQVESLTMAVRINQMMAQKMAQQLASLADGMANNTGMLNDFQYRAIAMQKLANVSSAQLQELTDELKLVDFESESAKKDTEGKFERVNLVESDADTVIISSATPEEQEDKGILRSRIKIADMGQPDLQEKIVGKTVGDRVEAVLGGVKHLIEIVGVRRAPVVEEKQEQ